jgi:hypothetical protein
MAIPTRRPLGQYFLETYSGQLGASPAVAYAVVPKMSRIVAIKCTQSAAVTGTSAVAVAVNGGTALSSLALSVTGGGAGTEFASTVNTTDLPNSGVNEDDVISLTPSGATGSATGTFTIILDGHA